MRYHLLADPPGDDDLVPIDEQNDDPSESTQPSWRILVTDDDPLVHATTTLALKHEKIAGRPLELLHASSALEARDILAGDAAIHLILLDVVMETEDAGLRLVPVLRGELGRESLRIVIRTGQPGYADELEIRTLYRIDAFVLKADLTRGKLLDLLRGLLIGDGGSSVH